jgi:hypothetical protein
MTSGMASADMKKEQPEQPTWPEPKELIAELDRRRAQFKANPEVVEPFEPDYFEDLKKRLRR